MLRYILLFFCLIINLKLSQSSCLQAKCMEDTTENKDKCQIFHDSFVELKKCKEGQTCSRYEFPNAFCQSGKKDQEKCSVPTDCYSGSCINSVCEGKGEGQSCSTHYECQKSLLCLGTCQKFKAPGDECNNFLECPFGYSCGSNKEGEKPKCMKYYSIKNGQYSTNQDLCETGYISRDNKCATSTSLREGLECNQDEDCPIKIKVGDNPEVEGYGKCVCATSGRTLCEYSTSNSNFQKYLNTLKNYHNSENKNEYIALAKTAFTYEVRKVIATSTLEYKDAPQCVIDFLIGDNDTPTPPPSPSSSNYINSIYMILLFFVLF